MCVCTCVCMSAHLWMPLSRALSKHFCVSWLLPSSFSAPLGFSLCLFLSGCLFILFWASSFHLYGFCPLYCHSHFHVCSLSHQIMSSVRAKTVFYLPVPAHSRCLIHFCEIRGWISDSAPKSFCVCLHLSASVNLSEASFVALCITVPGLVSGICVFLGGIFPDLV